MTGLVGRLALGILAVAVLPLPAMAADTSTRRNVLGGALQLCCDSPKTGYARDGMCRAMDSDHGTHTVCAIVTQDFLQFTRDHGNDLTTPRHEYQFPGLKAGDRWCLCALRWREAFKAGVAPPIDLAATDVRTLEFVSLAELQAHTHQPN